MAYIVKNTAGEDITEAIRGKEYSGGAIYGTELLINNVLIPEDQIAKIVIKSPIIDTTSNMFYVGSFISQQITITFRNIGEIPVEIKSGLSVSLNITMKYNGEDIAIPIGIYAIDDLAEDYQKKNEIVCLDRAVKLKQTIDYSPCFNLLPVEKDGVIKYTAATLGTILEYICTTFNIELEEGRDTTNEDIVTGFYDSTISAKQWISYIAELKGCNVKMTRTGTLKFVPLKPSNPITINALESKSWELGEKFKISRVKYEIEGYENGDTTDRTLYIRTDNPFIKSQDIIDKIAEKVIGTEIWTVKNENFGDITMDAWDTIKFTLGDDTSYTTLNDNTITFEQSLMTKIETKVPTEQQTEAVNRIEPDDKVTKNILKRDIDLINGEINTTIEKVNENSSKITEINESIDGLKINFQKSGNNLVRNSMFYDFEGWLSSPTTVKYKCNTVPIDPEDGDMWWCTGKVDTYEENKIYFYAGVGTETGWFLSDLLVSDLSKNDPLIEHYSIEASSNTKETYLSGRAINFKQNTDIVYPLYSDLFDISPYENKITASFRYTTSLGANKAFMMFITFVSYDDEIQKVSEKEKYFLRSVGMISEENANNSLIKQTLDIPNLSNANEVYYSTTEPTDMNVWWLKPYNDDLYQLYIYNSEEWIEIQTSWHLKDQNGNIYVPTLFQKDETTKAWAFKKAENNTININKAYISFQLEGDEDNPSTCQIGDIKVEYGEYSEWSPKRTEVMGLTHLLDETGYKIRSGDDTMRIMVDEIAQYYKDTKTFWLNKYEGYMKNAISETTNVNGLITQKFTSNNNTMYGRYIK